MPTNEAIAEAQRLSVPSWPLQNTVAVNPFWNLRDREFNAVMSDLAPLLHRRLYMPLAYYLERYSRGHISEDALASALEMAQKQLPTAPETLDELIWNSSSDRSLRKELLIFAEFYAQKTGDGFITQLLVDELSKYAAAYLDQGQAVASFPWQGQNFWEAWKGAQAYDDSMDAAGFKGFQAQIGTFAGLTAEDFIAIVLKNLAFSSARDESLYLSRLLALHLGWSTQFSLATWQKPEGAADAGSPRLIDFLAVSLAYDYVLTLLTAGDEPELLLIWKRSFAAIKSSQNSRVHEFELHQIWQYALELSYQRNLAACLDRPLPEVPPARYQIVTCIDVRSETLRRALEKYSELLSTIGFAGFFGLPFAYQRLGEKKPQARLPVLLSPAFTVQERAKTARGQAQSARSLSQAFFRNLRKGPLSSFLYVELFGMLALGRLLKRISEAFFAPFRSRRLPRRFDDRDREPTLAFHGEADIDRLAAVLRHMGLVRDFGALIIIAGHGSATANNAFASALDCGACGGHAGDISARLLAGQLNEPKVRAGLRERGIDIPEASLFLPAIHETVSDQLFILDQDKVPERWKAELQNLQAVIDRASRSAQRERQKSRSVYLDKHPVRRSLNWSELRPEWGLAGNACFIVAPRQWTRGLNLSSRSFLHDYRWQDDQDFKTLELILTAPMVVTNWINLQYYASTVAPDIYGAGNKILHNLVNEMGVLEGNAGGLRVGLPWQSVHDGEQFVHEPLRLSVFIAAPEAAIEAIIAKHSVVRDLVDKAWLYILRIDDSARQVSRRQPGGSYEAV